MKQRAWIGWAVGVAVLVLGTVSAAEAETVIFTNINDATPSTCYDSTTTAPDSLNPNKLIIGIKSGIGLVATPLGNAYIDRGCTASTSSFSSRNTADTISFQVEAPAGFYVSKITFTQSGTTTAGRGGQSFVGALWVVDQDAENLLYSGSTAKTWSGTVNLTGQNKTLVPVAITTYLTAAGISPQYSSASITNPSVVVEVLPLP